MTFFVLFCFLVLSKRHGSQTSGIICLMFCVVLHLSVYSLHRAKRCSSVWYIPTSSLWYIPTSSLWYIPTSSLWYIPTSSLWYIPTSSLISSDNFYSILSSASVDLPTNKFEEDRKKKKILSIVISYTITSKLAPPSKHPQYLHLIKEI